MQPLLVAIVVIMPFDTLNANRWSPLTFALYFGVIGPGYYLLFGSLARP
jgi:hypothetical protein